MRASTGSRSSAPTARRWRRPSALPSPSTASTCRATTPRITSVEIDAPVVDVMRGADGTLEWARLLAVPSASTSNPPSTGASPPAVATAPAAARPPPWAVSIGKLAIARGSIALADQSSGFQSTLVDVALDASNLTTKSGEKAHVKLAFVSADRIASFSGEADVEPMVPAASGHFALSKFSLGLLFPYYQSALAVDVQKGSLDYASAFALDASGNLRLTGGEAAIADLRLAVPGNPDPLWRLPQMALRSIDVDVAARKVTVGDTRQPWRRAAPRARIRRHAGGRAADADHGEHRHLRRHRDLDAAREEGGDRPRRRRPRGSRAAAAGQARPA